MSAELLRVAIVSTSLARRDRIASMLVIPGIQNTGAVATIGELGQLAAIPDAVVVEPPADIAVDALLESSPPPLPIVILTDELDHNAGVRLLLAGSVAILERDPPAALRQRCGPPREDFRRCRRRTCQRSWTQPRSWPRLPKPNGSHR